MGCGGLRVTLGYSLGVHPYPVVVYSTWAQGSIGTLLPPLPPAGARVLPAAAGPSWDTIYGPRCRQHRGELPGGTGGTVG